MLRLLDEVSYDGHPVAGERSQALLAALAVAGGRAVAEGDLVEAVWGADVPANPAKALQVVVSRTRSQTAADVEGLQGTTTTNTTHRHHLHLHLLLHCLSPRPGPDRCTQYRCQLISS